MKVASCHVTVAGVAVQRHGDQIVVRVVADEVDDGDALLALAFTQTSSQLLREHDAGLRAAQHDDLVQRRNINAFVEQVDGEDVVEFSCFQPLYRPFTFLCGYVAGKGDGTIWLFRLLVDLHVEQLGQPCRLVYATAEHQPGNLLVVWGVGLDLVDDIPHTFRRG